MTLAILQIRYPSDAANLHLWELAAGGVIESSYDSSKRVGEFIRQVEAITLNSQPQHLALRGRWRLHRYGE
jgi:hypothetical protein